MGRIAESWKLKTDPRTGIKSVRFRHNGKRYDRTTGERDPALARTKAAQVYARIVSGKDAARVGRSKHSLLEHFAAWLEDIEGEIGPNAHNNYRATALSILEPAFESLDQFTKENIAGFYRTRLKTVLRCTVRQDKIVLRRFLLWCVEKRLITALPEIPQIGKAAGTRHAVTRKESAVPLTHKEANAIVAALPAYSVRAKFHVRARFVVQWETSLRQATIARLRVPEHYRKGSSTLIITDPIDKAKFGRTLPLTDAARAALDEVCPDVGLIFGARPCLAYKRYLTRAARAAGLPEDKARAFSAYDLRHGRITTLLVDGAPLPAVAFLAGHTQLTTTNRYVAIAQAGDAAAQVLRNSGGISGGESNVTPINRQKKRA